MINRISREIHELTAKRARLQEELDATNAQLDAARVRLSKVAV